MVLATVVVVIIVITDETGLESVHPQTSSPQVSSLHTESVHPIVKSVHPTYYQSVHPTHEVSSPQHMNIVFTSVYLFIFQYIQYQK